MKNSLKPVLVFCVFVVFLVLFPSIIYAQDCPDFGDPEIPCPIDGGVGTLIALGLIYGVKKIFLNKRR